MGFLDKLKSAVSTLTGGGARVTIELEPSTGFAGDRILAKVSVTSTGNEIKSKGIFIDLRSVEEVLIKKDRTGADQDICLAHTLFEESFQIAPELVLDANETRLFEGTFQLPDQCEPSYSGHFTKHKWTVRGRMEAFGNDPDSGFKPFRVGLKG
jgi:hypothetical protein